MTQPTGPALRASHPFVSLLSSNNAGTVVLNTNVTALSSLEGAPAPAPVPAPAPAPGAAAAGAAAGLATGDAAGFINLAVLEAEMDGGNAALGVCALKHRT